MGEKERSEKDLRKLSAIISYFKSARLGTKYPAHLEFAENYAKDARHYHARKDYFSSFGCANYAYGILEGIILRESGKAFHELEKGEG